MSSKPDFYLTSTETQNIFEARECYIEKRLLVEGRRDEMLIVRVSPHILGQPYGLGDKNIERLVLAIRYAETSLFPVNEWPLYVYVCRIMNDDILELGKACSEDIQIIMWGELYKTLKEANRVVEQYKKQINL